MNLPLHHYSDAVNAFQKLEDPAQGRALSWLIDLVWYGRVLVCQLLTQSTLGDGIHEQC